MHYFHFERAFFAVKTKCVLKSVAQFRVYTVSDACGGIIEATNGTITSPSFPDLYPGNKSCIWEIIAPAQFKITLNFTHFDLEGNNVSKNVARAQSTYAKRN